MKTTKRLEELLDQKDAEIKRLADELEKANDRKERDWEWAAHVDFGESHHPELPLPRLEMEWKKNGDTWQDRTAFYHLIYRHTLGHVVGVPMGSTNIRSSHDISPLASRSTRGGIDTPFRDGVHLANDSKQLGLPAFVICEDEIDVLTLVGESIHQIPFHK